MSHVIFKFDIEKDAKNYYDCANSDPHWGHDFTKSLRPEVLKKLRGKKWIEIREDTINMLKKGYSQHEEEKNKKLEKIQEAWNKIEKNFFKRLAKITGRKIYTNEFIGYITTIGRCPYNPKEDWFMTNLFWDLDNTLATAAHEIIHLQFHHYFEYDLKRKISNEKFQNLKEALTVLLNVEFSDLLKEKDVGYPKHKKLREFISRKWEKEKNFKKLLEKCVDYSNKFS